MTRALLTILAFAALFFLGLAVIHAAHAGDDAPGALLWPQEPRYAATVIETTCTALHDCCGIYRACGSGWDKPIRLDPAPVPLPPTFSLLMFALAYIFCVYGLIILPHLERKRTNGNP